MAVALSKQNELPNDRLRDHPRSASGSRSSLNPNSAEPWEAASCRRFSRDGLKLLGQDLQHLVGREGFSDACRRCSRRRRYGPVRAERRRATDSPRTEHRDRRLAGPASGSRESIKLLRASVVTSFGRSQAGVDAMSCLGENLGDARPIPEPASVISTIFLSLIVLPDTRCRRWRARSDRCPAHFGEARKATTSAISPGWPIRFCGAMLAMRATSASALPLRNSPSPPAPGPTALTVILRVPSSRPEYMVKACSASWHLVRPLCPTSSK
jgi:hypothetical protein